MFEALYQKMSRISQSEWTGVSRWRCCRAVSITLTPRCHDSESADTFTAVKEIIHIRRNKLQIARIKSLKINNASVGACSGKKLGDFPIFHDSVLGLFGC